MSAKKLYTERMEVCITDSLKKKLESYAKKNDVSVNHVVREAVKLLIGDKK